MKRYVNTIAQPQSGESIEMIQLAEAMDAEVVHHVPLSGLVVYMINLNLRPGTNDFKTLATRKIEGSGINAIVIGTLKGWDEAEKWKPYFDVLRKISDIVFVHNLEQKKYLRQFDIDALVKPINEKRYLGNVLPKQGTVAYSGFLWAAKNLKIFQEVARLLPEWRFTIHVGQNTQTHEKLPSNCIFNGEFITQDRYLEFLAGFEYIWIPRLPNQQVYAGRSGTSAVASGRPAILTDVMANDIIPRDAAIMYPADWTAEKVAELIDSRPCTNPDAVSRFLDSVDPKNVWAIMKDELSRRGFSDF
ncbi:MAG: hypothetical protein GY847_31945 [Proteobacteria bacterium]|nr:hypothetical protein [Pseudomonadota bacterium]